MKLVERFLSKVEKTDTCWLWKASKDHFGYGWFSINSKMFRAHRIAYELFVSPISSEVIMHTCDNPQCVNPEHLRPGTNKDNSDDKVTKGRQSRLHGETNPKAELKAWEVRRIRRLYSYGVSQSTLRRVFKLKQAQCSRIITFRTWKSA